MKRGPDDPALSTRTDTWVFWASFCVAAALAPPGPEVSAVAAASFVWVRGPSVPGENTRIDTVALLTPSCVATAEALSSTSLGPSAGGTTVVEAVAATMFD